MQLPVAPPRSRILSVMAFNGTTGTAQAYNAGDAGSRILAAVKPDIALLQEANIGSAGSTDREFAQWVQATLGDGYSFVRTQGDQIPNAVVFKTALAKIQGVEIDDPLANNRDHAEAILEVPGLGKLVAVSVHMLTRGPDARKEEGDALAGAVARSLAAMPGAFAVIGGDFNTDTHDVGHEPIFGELAEVVVTQRANFPLTFDGHDGTNGHDTKPYDGVFTSPALEALEVPVVLAGQRFPGGLVLDTRAMTPAALAELPGVRQSDSGALNMQHHAVLRYFQIPVAQ